jgi:hypothetical protein
MLTSPDPMALLNKTMSTLDKSLASSPSTSQPASSETTHSQPLALDIKSASKPTLSPETCKGLLSMLTGTSSKSKSETNVMNLSSPPLLSPSLELDTVYKLLMFHQFTPGLMEVS